MRRTLAAAALAAGLFAAAGCSDDGDGGGGDDGAQSTDEVCTQLVEQVDPLMNDLTTAMADAAIAAGQGDDAAAAESALAMNDSVEQITETVRGAAEDAEDAEFSAALNTFADELEALAGSVAAGEQPDQTAFAAAADELGSYCEGLGTTP